MAATDAGAENPMEGGLRETLYCYYTMRPIHSMAKLTPTVTPQSKQPKYGFHMYAEKLNGRAAMVGFAVIIAIEYFTGRGLLSWIGLT